MSTLTLARADAGLLEPGDVVVAIDDRPLRRPLTVESRGLVHVAYDTQGVRLVNPLGTDTEWVLYPDTQVERTLTVQRVDPQVLPCPRCGQPVSRMTATSAMPHLTGPGTWCERSTKPAAELNPAPAESTPVEPEPAPLSPAERADLTLAAKRLDRIAHAAQRGESLKGTRTRVDKVLPLLVSRPDLQAATDAAVGARWKPPSDRADALRAVGRALGEILGPPTGRRTLLGTVSAAAVEVGARIYVEPTADGWQRRDIGPVMHLRASELRSQARRDRALVATVTRKGHAEQGTYKGHRALVVETDLGGFRTLPQVMLALAGEEQ